MPDDKRPLKIFPSMRFRHDERDTNRQSDNSEQAFAIAHADKAQVRELYRFLKRRGLQPWLDTEDLLPGQTWQIHSRL